MATLSRQYCKLCDVQDFEDPELLDAVRSLLPERDPLAHIERKVWEFAMVALFLEDVARLHEHTEVLSVGAGDERILFWLAQRVGRVVATDVYGEGEFAEREAGVAMLDDPSSRSPWPYPRERLEVTWMDARDLSFEDASFDCVFTLSSIEHFGSPADIGAAAAEIGRVLRPGGHAIVVTELLVELHPLDRAAVQVAKRVVSFGRRRRDARLGNREGLEAFTERELRRQIVEPSRLRMLQPLDTGLSDRSWDNLTRLSPRGMRSRTGSRYPMVLMQAERSVFTSVCLVLEKPQP